MGQKNDIANGTTTTRMTEGIETVHNSKLSGTMEKNASIHSNQNGYVAPKEKEEFKKKV